VSLKPWHPSAHTGDIAPSVIRFGWRRDGRRCQTAPDHPSGWRLEPRSASKLRLPSQQIGDCVVYLAPYQNADGARTRAFIDDVNQLGRLTGQSERLRKVTPHRLCLSTIAALAGGRVESLADLLREFNHQNDVTVAYKAFYNRLARPGFAARAR
jgi:hypothetical protein